MAAQLDIIADTKLREDPRLAPRPLLRQTCVKAAAPSASSSLTARVQNPVAPSASSSVDPRIAAIDRRRAAAGIAHDQFARLAGVNIWTWRDLRRGNRAPMGATLAKLQAALDAPRETKPPQVVAAFHRLVMQTIAMQMAFDLAMLLATDFSVQRPSNPQWLRAARIRQMASYITSVELGVSNADLGRAIGDTRANIKYARDAIEDLREDGNEIDRVLVAVTQLVRA
ncbi:hypothetical protein ASC80_01640 [Afipia sp. Root123D2]|uniref:hypothetical protein n=1 Tax=Afipia sp. Root123D2 TaxID=1736436 RepID=UPI0006FAE891|nr:hypothetical protein [Afipia sp. Root123D2]KQW22125.1 hypothetical protein ASC80_01640 [Afipia sp. Root123D2]